MLGFNMFRSANCRRRVPCLGGTAPPTRPGHGPMLGALLALAAIGPASAGLIFDVAFNDPGEANADYYAAIESHVLAAGALWDAGIAGDAELEVEVSFDNTTARASGRSATSSYVSTIGSINVFEQGAAAEINNGIDPNGPAPDIQFYFNTTYLADELWFDPNPFARNASIPDDKTDALSVIVHEFAHAFGFNGWRDPFTGELPANYMSTFDVFAVFDGADFFFSGAEAVFLYGADVPLTYGNIYHVGNAAPRPGSDLIPDLMNGVVYDRGFRYDISALDFAMLSDAGLPIQLVAVPLPMTWTLVLVGFVALHRHTKRKRPLSIPIRKYMSDLWTEAPKARA